MKTYLQEKWKMLLAGASFLVFLNLYFGVFCASKIFAGDLLYLDGLLCLAGGLFLWRDFYRWDRERKKRLLWEAEREKEEALIQDLKEQIRETADYTAKWAHEVKLPLASLRLMNERNEDEELSREMKDCFERIGQLLNTMLMGSKLKNMENDLYFERFLLSETIQEAIKNQSYFLIRDGFQISSEVGELAVISDKRWLVYVLDQLIGNAVKYKKEHPKLSFGGEKAEDGSVCFWVRDEGIGILSQDLPYLFEKGYIGGNLRSGDYRSTGMGLYFVKKTCDRLGICLKAESDPGIYTKFILIFPGEFHIHDF